MINSPKKEGPNEIWTHVLKNDIQAEGKLYMGVESTE
jgi:methylphosphotriester-DNA--protein-cysteine methyltransferase